MNLYVLRHGQAEAVAPRDEMRSLTQQGIADTKKMLNWLLAHELRPNQSSPLNPVIDSIIASPYTRTQQTAKIALSQLGVATSIQTTHLVTPDSDPIGFLKEILRHLTANTLLVTHQPFMGKLISYLVTGHSGMRLSIETSSLALVRFEREMIGLGLGNLVWLKNVKDLNLDYS